MSYSSTDSTVSTSLLAKFDELSRNSRVLLEASEERFLEFVQDVTVWRKRWENAELECQRLSIELTKEAQCVLNMESKLNQARGMLEREIGTRKRAENERDQLQSHLMLLRNLVMDDKIVGQGTLRKIRDLDNGLPSFSGQVLSPGLYKDRDQQQGTDLTMGSILNVDDLSFDDTVDLCESRTRAGTMYKDSEWEESGRGRSGKRGRSGGIGDLKSLLNSNNLEAVASPRTGGETKKRRSRSVGFREPLEDRRAQDEDTSSDEMPKVPQVPQPMGRNKAEAPRPTFSTDQHKSGVEADSQMYGGEGMILPRHNFVQKTVLKRENCDVCLKRIKFGKIFQKCRGCDTNLHMECVEKIHPLCEGASKTYDDMRSTPDPFSTPSKSGIKQKQIFASPMLR